MVLVTVVVIVVQAARALAGRLELATVVSVAGIFLTIFQGRETCETCAGWFSCLTVDESCAFAILAAVVAFTTVVAFTIAVAVAVGIDAAKRFALRRPERVYMRST